jgi:hypothetical protein
MPGAVDPCAASKLIALAASNNNVRMLCNRLMLSESDVQRPEKSPYRKTFSASGPLPRRLKRVPENSISATSVN